MSKILIFPLFLLVLGLFYFNFQQTPARPSSFSVQNTTQQVLSPTPIVVPTEKPTPTWSVTAVHMNGPEYATYPSYYDTTMGTPQEILNALNVYRESKGLLSLSMDSTLSAWAQQRADFFVQNGDVDQHQGFLADTQSFFNEHPQYKGLGENGVAIPHPLSGPHVIANFSADPGHDDTQLRADRNVVGIGVSTGKIIGIDLIFGQKN